MFQLNNLSKLTKKRKRVGRGGCKGGTSGKGHKGQKARSGGYVRSGFEGGQTPLSRRLPKRGFNNYNFKKDYQIVSIEKIHAIFNNGDEVTKDLLVKNRIIKKINSLVKVLVKNRSFKLSKKISIIADAFSDSARHAIENSGGKAHLI